MNILMAASEMVPFAKTGGLADVLAALPRELAARGHEVHVVLPFYRCVRETAKLAEPTGKRVTVPLGTKQVSGDIWRLVLAPHLTVLFIRRDEYFDRSELYCLPERDYEDNAERFIFFSKATVSMISALQLRPDIIHCHDWQTALVPLYASLAEAEGAFPPPKTIFTIHNLLYQGRFWNFDFPLLNLPDSFFSPEALEFYGQINLLKAGIVFSSALTTVSRKYALEIQTPEYGCGLEGVLRSRSADLHGILNGADYTEWNPETDPLIASRFSAQGFAGKEKCKLDLLKQYKLRADSAPLIGIVSRLASQKGFDIFAEVVDELLTLNGRWVFLGTGEKRYEELLTSLAEKYPRRIAVRIGFDNALAHKIEAGSDFFLMPSRYEPCGLNQMYSLRYATIPIVRATGGLDDTIENYRSATGEGNGFKFAGYAGKELLEKVREALGFYEDKIHWRKLRQNAMACDFSWARAAAEYEKVYVGPRNC